MTRPWPLLCLLGLAACAGTSSGQDPQAAADEPKAAAIESAAPPWCATRLEVTEKSSGAATTLTSGGAVSLGGGAAYTLYAADFPIDTSGATVAYEPQGPPEGHVAMLAATVLNANGHTEPIAAGTAVAAGVTPGELVLVTRYDAGQESFNNNSGATGQITFDEVGESVCVTVDYADEEKQMTGTIASPTAAVS